MVPTTEAKALKLQEDVPNPGSQEAVELGCTCAVIDNHHGAGEPRGGGTVRFYLNGDCPLHIVKDQSNG